VKEFIHNGTNGFLVPEGDTQKCADIIVNLHRSRDHLVRLSQTAHQTALARPSWTDTLDSIHYFLTHLARQSRAQNSQKNPL
jgi:hypothetical protein